jgi:ketosteroid isomerase-like protein
MTNDDAAAYAAQWTRDWNNRDIDAVLAHFHQDVEFTSPTALAVMGAPTIRGTASLREYWAKALSQIISLRFTLDRVVWDGSRRELAIIYTSDINGKAKRVSENLRFDDQARVVAAEVFHGIPC